VREQNRFFKGLLPALVAGLTIWAVLLWLLWWWWVN
jgi:hypothetical protein